MDGAQSSAGNPHMIPRVPGVIQMALIDAISAQHQILGMNAERTTVYPVAHG